MAMKINPSEIDGISLVGYRNPKSSILRIALCGSHTKAWPKQIIVNGVEFDLDHVHVCGKENHLDIGIVIREEANYIA